MFSQGEELKKNINAAAYIECSSKTQQVRPFLLPFNVTKSIGAAASI